MPSTICNTCKILMDYFYRFKQMCKKSDTALRQYPLTGTLPKACGPPKLPEDLVTKQYIMNSAQIKQEIMSTIEKSTETEEQQIQSIIQKQPVPNLLPSGKGNSSVPNATPGQHVIKQENSKSINKNTVKILNKNAQSNTSNYIKENILGQTEVKLVQENGQYAQYAKIIVPVRYVGKQVESKSMEKIQSIIPEHPRLLNKELKKILKKSPISKNSNSIQQLQQELTKQVYPSVIINIPLKQKIPIANKEPGDIRQEQSRSPAPKVLNKYLPTISQKFSPNKLESNHCKNDDDNLENKKESRVLELQTINTDKPQTLNSGLTKILNLDIKKRIQPTWNTKIVENINENKEIEIIDANAIEGYDSEEDFIRNLQEEIRSIIGYEENDENQSKATAEESSSPQEYNIPMKERNKTEESIVESHDEHLKALKRKNSIDTITELPLKITKEASNSEELFEQFVDTYKNPDSGKHSKQTIKSTMSTCIENEKNSSLNACTSELSEAVPNKKTDFKAKASQGNVFDNTTVISVEVASITRNSEITEEITITNITEQDQDLIDESESSSTEKDENILQITTKCHTTKVQKDSEKQESGNSEKIKKDNKETLKPSVINKKYKDR